MMKKLIIVCVLFLTSCSASQYTNPCYGRGSRLSESTSLIGAIIGNHSGSGNFPISVGHVAGKIAGQIIEDGSGCSSPYINRRNQQARQITRFCDYRGCVCAVSAPGGGYEYIPCN